MSFRVGDPKRLAEVVRHGLSLPHDNLHFGLNGQVFDMDELVESLVCAYLDALDAVEFEKQVWRGVTWQNGELVKRVEKLEEENERLKGYERSVDAYMKATNNYQRSLQIEQAKSEELEGALLFYTNPRNYRWLGDYEPEVLDDGGKRARAALSPSRSGEASEEEDVRKAYELAVELASEYARALKHARRALMGDTHPGAAVAHIDNALDASKVLPSAFREAPGKDSAKEERILEDVLDVVTGWTKPMSAAGKLATIQAIAGARLKEIREASEEEGG